MLCFSVTIVPAALKTILSHRTLRAIDDSKKCEFRRIHAVNSLSLACQLSSICLWVYYVYITIGSFNTQSVILMMFVALSPILVSLTWWENFVKVANSRITESENSNIVPSWLMRLQLDMEHNRAQIGCLVNLYKIVIVLLVMPIFMFGIFCENGDACIKTLFFQQSTGKLSYIGNATMTTSLNNHQDCISGFPLLMSVVNIISSMICFKLAKTACKVLAQQQCFVLPILLSTPVVIGIILSLYGETLEISFGKCILPMPVWKDIIEIPSVFSHIFDTYWVVIVAGTLSYISFFLVTNHVWIRSNERLVATDRLIMLLFYNQTFRFL